MGKSAQVKIRRDQNMLKEGKAEVEVDPDEDRIAEEETNIHTADHPGGGREVTAETNTTPPGEHQGLPTGGRDIPGGDILGPDQDLGGEIARRKLKIDITE